jgi:homopolymeric O-antigen transport system ATP-binding protein
MSDVVVSVENLSKRYLIGHRTAQRERYTVLRDIISREARNFTRKAVDLMRGRQIVQGDEVEELWALKDVNFEVRQGEVLGIIGRNGAGKSTLLKILSRITEPTEGRVRIRGRVGSLLEVGTGFHPELTGRENIFLNGAILGMGRAEIARKFDEIVAFAEVEKFVDTPVKRYSSGMYVRLAFAVAAHLETEILIVDEVLAVGDVDFQRKCLGKIGEVAGGGRTVLFVSHNMAAIETLCPRTIHLASGIVLHDGNTKEVAAAYLNERKSSLGGRGSRAVTVQKHLVLESTRIVPSTFRSGAPVEFEFLFRAMKKGQIRECAVTLYTAKGFRVALHDVRESGALPFRYEVGQFSIRTRVMSLPLGEGDYFLGVYLRADEFYGDLYELADFSVMAPLPSDDFIPYPAEDRGVLALSAASSVGAVAVEAASNG